MKQILALTIAVLSLSPLVINNVSAASADQTVVAIAASNADFSTLVTAVKAAGLVDTLNGAGPFTIFAPTNAAFAKLPKGVIVEN